MNTSHFKKNSKTVCFSSLYVGQLRGRRDSLIDLPSLEIEKRIDVLPLPKNILKILHRSGFLRIRDLLDHLDSSSLGTELTLSDWKYLRFELEKRNLRQRTLFFENRKLLVLILTELSTCPPRDIDSLSNKDLSYLCDNSLGEVSALNPSAYVVLVRWLENVLQNVTNCLLVPWLRNRGGIGTLDEITYWMALRSEESSLIPVLTKLFVKGFMWEPFIWGPYLKAVQLKSFDRAFCYVIDEEKESFLYSLFELLNLCFYKRGQLYKFEYVLQLVQRDVAPQEMDLRNVLIRLFASIPGLKMVRTPDCLLVEKTGSNRFFLDQ